MVSIERLKGAEHEIIFAPLLEMKQEIKTEKTDRKAYFKEYNDRMKEKRKLERLKKKSELDSQDQEATSKYYGAEAIKVLISFKEYTELSKKKRQLWLDFNGTMKDCWESKEKGLMDIVFIMKLNQVAERLIKDFGETAKSEERKRSKGGNLLDYDEQKRLVKFWGRKKANVENGYIDENERLENQGEQGEKEIEIQKNHEERGKIGCDCSKCQYETEIREEAKAKIKQKEKELLNYGKKQDNESEVEEGVKGDCANCYENKKVSTESGLCKKCERETEQE